MELLLYFIAGVLFIQYFVPIFDGISTLFLTWIEAKKASLGIDINTAELKVRKALAELDEGPPQPLIGFEIPNSIECEEEEDEKV